MKYIKEYAEEIQALVGVGLVGAYMLNYIELNVVVMLLGLLSASATTTLKRALKKAGKVGDRL